MFITIFSWLAEQMPFLKENALGQNKAIFIKNILFSNCADYRLYNIYFQCKDPIILGKVYKQNRARRQAEYKVLKEISYAKGKTSSRNNNASTLKGNWAM